MPRESENSAPAIITDHPFEPRAEWWTVCDRCGLAEAAHATNVVCEACGEPAPVDSISGLCSYCESVERPA